MNMSVHSKHPKLDLHRIRRHISGRIPILSRDVHRLQTRVLLQAGNLIRKNEELSEDDRTCVLGRSTVTLVESLPFLTTILPRSPGSIEGGLKLSVFRL